MEIYSFTPFATRDDLCNALLEQGYEDTIVLLDLDYTNAVIGIDDDGRLIYSYDLMVEFLCHEDGMTREEAEEFINYNTLRALPYMGDKHPLVIHTLQDPMVGFSLTQND